MRAGAGAAVGVVAELVDVHAALGGGVVALDVVGDGGGAGLGGLLKGDGAADGGVPADDCDCFWVVRVSLGKSCRCSALETVLRNGRIGSNVLDCASSMRQVRMLGNDRLTCFDHFEYRLYFTAVWRLIVWLEEFGEVVDEV